MRWMSAYIRPPSRNNWVARSFERHADAIPNAFEPFMETRLPKKPPPGRPSEGGDGAPRGAQPGSAAAPPYPVAQFREMMLRLSGSPPLAATAADDFFDDVVQTLRQLLMEEQGGDPSARRLR